MNKKVHIGGGVSHTLYYLNRDVLYEHADVKLVSEDKLCLSVNHLILVSHSAMFFDLFNNLSEVEDVTILTDISACDLLILVTYMTEGILPSNWTNKEKIFKHFGVITQKTQNKVIKLEPKEEEPMIFDPWDNHEPVKFKQELTWNSDSSSDEEEEEKVLSLRNRKVETKVKDVQLAIKNERKRKPWLSDSGEDSFYLSDQEIKTEMVRKVGRPRKSTLHQSNETVNYEDEILGSKLAISKAKFQERVKNYIVVGGLGTIGNRYKLPLHPKSYLKYPDLLPNVDPGKGLFKCRECPQRFGSVVKRKTHVKRCHQLCLVCPHCSMSFGPNYLENFTFHMSKHEMPQALDHECINCGYTNHTTQHIERHIRSKGPHHDNKCAQCDTRVWSYHEHRLHVEEEHKNVWKYRCGKCGKVFDSEEDRSRCSWSHTRAYKGGGPKKKKKPSKVVCDQCGVLVVNEKDHKVRVHAEKTFQCPQCLKPMGSEAILRNHFAEVHETGPCPTCGKSVKVRKMRRHVLMYHTKDCDRPFVCQVCQKGFIVKKSFEEHMNTHTGDKPYKCKYCGTGFASSGNQRMHERMSHEGYKRQPKGQ